jgi:ATP-binding cassette, subfamily B, bacterial
VDRSVTVGTTAEPPVLRRAGMIAALRLLVSAARLATAGAVTLALLAGLAPTVSAVATRDLIDGLISHDRGRVVWSIAFLLGVMVAAAVFTPLARYLQTEIDRRVELAVSDRLFAALNAVPRLDQFEQPVFHDRARLAQQAGLRAPQDVGTGLVTLLQGAVTLAGFAVALAAVSIPAAALMLGSILPSAAIGIRLSRKRAEAEMALSPGRRRTMFYALMQTDVRAAKEIRLFGLGDFLRNRMLSVLRAVLSTERGRDRVVAGWQLVIAVLTALCFAGAVGIVTASVWSGRRTVGDLALTVAALAAVQAGVAAITASLGQLANALALFDNYRDIVDTHAPVRTSAVRPAAEHPQRLERGLTLHDVWFRYDENLPWVLRGVDLHLAANTSTAIVGLNGAGKSTLVKLICGLYTPTRGTITWDGVPIESFDLDAYRARFSAVFQDFMTYDLTAAENIAMGDLDRREDRAAIETAARGAAVHETLVALPAGYDTFLSRVFMAEDTGERGATLSGGQWQRLAIARGLMRTAADVFVLDEPSSGLDPDAEYQLTRTLAELGRRRTSVLISHRLSAITGVDNIVVLADGVLAETGTHSALMAAAGSYRELFDKQASGYRADEVLR